MKKFFTFQQVSVILVALTVGIILGELLVFLFYIVKEDSGIAFSNYMKGTQSAVLSMGALVGGAWTVITFNSLGTIRKEAASLEKAQRELREHTSLLVAVNYSILENTAENGYIVEITASLENIGNRVAEVGLSNESFGVSKLLEDKSGRFVTEWEKSFPVQNTSMDVLAAHLLPGDKDSYSTVCRLKDPGVYTLNFWAKIPDSEINNLVALGFRRADFQFWGAHKVMYLGGTPNVATLTNGTAAHEESEVVTET